MVASFACVWMESVGGAVELAPSPQPAPGAIGGSI